MQKKWLAFIGITLLSFGCYLDYTVVNIALPTIQQDLQANLTSLQWVMNIYFLALCVLATIMGRCGDLYGRRRCFYIGVFIFAVASVIAGFSPTIYWLVFARLLQGVGAAIVFPLGPSLLPQAFPEKEKGKAIAWLGSMGGIALALGPVLGGAIVTYWGWRYIFFINIPIILVGYLFCYSVIEESNRDQSNSALDWKGMILLALTMCGIVLGLIQSEHAGWSNPETLSYLLIGLIAGVFLVKIERKQENPLIDFSDFSNILFYASAALCTLAGILSAVALFFDPLYLQIIREQSPQLSGWVLFAIPVAVFFVAFAVSGLINAFGIFNTLLLALGVSALSGLMQLFFTPDISLWYVILAFICLGTMWAMGNTVTLIAAQEAVGPHRHSVAMGTMVTMFNIGGSIGLAIAVVIYNFFATHSFQQEANFDSLKALISNPAHALTVSVTDETLHLFHQAFMQGFTAVMWFLFSISVLALLSVVTWKGVQRK